MNSLKFPYSKSLDHCLTESLQIYENKQWTIRQRDGRSVNPPSHHIILKSDNLQYDTLGHWVAGTNDSLTKRLMFQVLLF